MRAPDGIDAEYPLKPCCLRLRKGRLPNSAPCGCPKYGTPNDSGDGIGNNWRGCYMCHRAFPSGAVFQAILVSKQHPDYPIGGGRVQQVNDTSPFPRLLLHSRTPEYFLYTVRQTPGAGHTEPPPRARANRSRHGNLLSSGGVAIPCRVTEQKRQILEVLGE